MIPHTIGWSKLYRGLPDGESHRHDYTRCPFCLEQMDVHVWVTTPYVKEVVLDNPRFGDNDKVIIIGTCPNCEMPSWGHWEVKTLGLYASPDWHKHEKYPYNMELIKIHCCN